MITDPLTALAVIAVAAFGCQFLAATLRVPSVTFLLAVGVALSSVLDPDAIFGELLFTGVGLGVAVLLFEGGSSLNWAKLAQGRSTVLRLVTIGALFAWAVATAAAMIALDVETELAVLIGAILIVSGPTVIMPLLRVVRPREPTGSILRWEGILIDPVGAGLAIVVLDAILEDRSPSGIALRVFETFTVGIIIGLVVTALMVLSLDRRAIADHLQVPATLAAIIASYGFANELRPEAGLIAVTVLGIGFANQRRAAAAHIVEFNEHLGAAILGFLFIVLGARVDLAEIVDYLPASLFIIAVLVLVARPLTVLASTLGTDVEWRDRSFLMVLAPRGVVAAAVASLFAIELEHHGTDPGPLVPVVFTVVVGTVLLSGLSARFAARRLRVARPTPNGVALIGGGAFAIELAGALGALDVPAIHIGLDEDERDQAGERGQLVFGGSLDSDDFTTAVESVGIAHAVALSGVDHLDSYATEKLSHQVGSENVYGLSGTVIDDGAGRAHSLMIRPLLPDDLDSQRVAALMDGGARLRIIVGPRHPRSGWLNVCRVTPDRDVVFDADPTTAGPDDHQVQFGPGLLPPAAN